MIAGSIKVETIIHADNTTELQTIMMHLTLMKEGILLTDRENNHMTIITITVHWMRDVIQSITINTTADFGMYEDGM